MSPDPATVVERWRARGRGFTAGGVGSFVWEQGDGEPVVCLHGVPSSAFLYRKLIDELSRRGLRGVAFDLPGLGLAARPPDFDYRWSGLARWCNAAVDALGFERFHLVVHDIAGPIGFDLLGHVRGRVRSLTVLNTMVRVATFKRPWSMEPFARRGIGPLYLATLRPRSFVALMRLQGVATRVPSEELRAYVLLLKRDDGGRAFLRIMRGFELTQEFESRILANLALRDYPAQVVWGERDPALRVDTHGEHVREALGLETIVRLPAKHFVPEDEPARIAELVVGLAASAR